MGANGYGYYYSDERHELLLASKGDELPRDGTWEYIGSFSDMTPADAVAALEERHPDVSVELTYRTLLAA